MEFILGTSAEERAEIIYERAAELSKDESLQILIVVPEQYTLETQKGIINKHPRHAILNIDVVSFNRLAYKVLERTGGDNLPMIRETGKNMLVRKVLNAGLSKLSYFSGSMKKRGFISELKSLLSELDQYSVSPKDLEKISESLKSGGHKRISDKISDLAFLFNEYKAELASRFFTCEDLLSSLDRRLGESSLLDNSYVFFDGFTGFTVSQYKIIETIIKKAKNTCFSLCYEGEELHPESTDAASGNLFFMSDKCIKTLEAINIKQGKPKPEFTFTDRGAKAESKRAPELEFLRHSFFTDPVRTDFKTRPVFKGETNSLCVLEADDIKEEVSLIIGKIRRLITDEGYRYRDIAVVMEDLESYGDLTFKLMEQNGFPVFLDRSKSISSNPFIENIRSFLALITEGFSYENVFRYIKSGFSPVGSDYCDELDNYCLATGIRTQAKWKNEWKRLPGKQKVNEKGEHESYYDIERLNALREKFYAFVTDYGEKLKKAEGVSEKLAVLASFLDEDCVTGHTRDLLESAIGEETRQAVKKTGELFRETDALFGAEALSTAEFADMLDAAFEEMSAGFIPPSNDCIIIGDTDRTRLTDIRALFIVGVNDGVIPKKISGGGILSDADRLRLAGEGIELAPSVREQAFIQKFYLYLLLTKPFDRLYLSYSRKNLQGESLMQSYLIDDMTDVFEDLKSVPAAESDLRLSEQGLVKSDLIWLPGGDEIILGPEAVLALYGNEVSGSISSFESFAGCPFTYFLKKGLKIYPRDRYEFNPADFGTIVHDILYRVLKSCTQKNIRPDSLSAAARDALVEEQLKTVESDYYILSDSERNGFVRYRIKQISSATLRAVGYQLAAGDFAPYGFEKRFVSEHAINGGKLKFTGVIDRSDISISGNEVYLRIVDYKTGQNEFDLKSFYHGRSLQLVSYMNEACAELKGLYPEKNVIPSALLYMIAKNPYALEEAKKLSEHDIEEQITDSFKMNGILSDDDLSLIKNDNEGRGDVIKGVGSKEGSRKTQKTSGPVSREQMELLRKYALKKTKDIAGEILSGEAAISPLEETGQVRLKVCAYCDYKSVCNYNGELSRSARSLIRCKDEELWERIKDSVH